MRNSALPFTTPPSVDWAQLAATQGRFWLRALLTIVLLVALFLATYPTPVFAAMENHHKRIPSFDYPYPMSSERIAAEPLLNEGLERAFKQDYEGAIALFSQAIDADPTYEMAYRYLGDIYRDLGHWQSAVDAYTHALKYNPAFARLYNSRGEILLVLGQYDEAISDFNHAIVVYPEDPVGYYNRGRAYTALKKYPQAFLSFRDALTISDNYAAAYVGRAEVRQAVDNPQGAIADYLTAAELYQTLAEQQLDQGDRAAYVQFAAQAKNLTAKAESIRQQSPLLVARGE